MPAGRPDPMHGTVVADKYEVVDTLGVGGNATVYRATRLTSQRTPTAKQVALKMLRVDHPEGDVEAQRFAREAEMLRKLQHPHIVGLVDYGHTEEQRPYLVFPVLEGRSLKERIEQDGAMPLEDVGRFSVQILRALEKAHSMNIAHRDLKPENLFLTKGVVGEMIQILDFGLARGALEDDEEGVTRVGSVVGTPRYIAPEQARGEEVGPPADIYSLGLVMGEMIAGRPLVDGKTQVDVFILQGSDQALELPDEVRHSPFGTVIRRAVDKDPAVRYHRAGQMLADVRSAIGRMSRIDDALGDTFDDDEDEDDDEFEATKMLDPNAIRQLSKSTEQSEQLRKAFNEAAKKRAAKRERKRQQKAEAAAAAADVTEKETIRPPKLVADVPSADEPPEADASTAPAPTTEARDAVPWMWVVAALLIAAGLAVWLMR